MYESIRSINLLIMIETCTYVYECMPIRVNSVLPITGVGEGVGVRENNGLGYTVIVFDKHTHAHVTKSHSRSVL